jgi:V/A-type H+-transporting ATPase subunit I
MFTILSLGCIGWGILTTAFFGMSIDPSNPIRKLSIVQYLAEKKVAYEVMHNTVDYQGWLNKYPDLANIQNPLEVLNYVPPQAKEQVAPLLDRINDGIMFELALFIGVVHLSLSLLRYARRNIPALGWVAFLVGGYLYVPFYLKAPSLLNYALGINLATGGTVGLELLAGGIIFAVIASVFKQGFTGIFEIMSVVQLFADVLSYLRLYALGLAGAIVATTINEAASGASPIIAFLLLFVSHSVNMALGTMSGVVHGLRLNFLEWYRYSFEGGGKEFQPLKLLKME